MFSQKVRIASGFQRAQQLGTGLVLGMGTLTVAGWILGLDALTRVLPHLPPMMFNSALCFLLLGLGLLDVLRNDGKAGRLAQTASLIICLIAGLTLAEFALGVPLGIDNLFMSHPNELGHRWPGRMDVISAVSFLAAGLSLVSLDLRLTNRWSVGTALAYLPPLPALFSLFDLVFQASILGSIAPGLGAMSLHTAVGFFATAVALIALRSRAGITRLFAHGGAVGRAARFQFLIVLPLVVGLIVIVQLGIDSGALPGRMALAVRATVLVLALIAAFWRSLEDLARADRAILRSLHETEAARDTLEHAVQHRTIELSASNAALTREIVERQRLSQAVEESERRFRQLVEGAPVGIMLLDRQGLLSYANPVLTGLAERSRDVLLGVGWKEALHAEDYSSIVEQCSQAVQQRELTQCEGRLRLPDGRTAWAVFRFQPLYGAGGTLAGLVGTVSEITRRKEAEELLRIQKEELEQLLHIISHDLREPLRAVQSFSRLIGQDEQQQLSERSGDYLQRVIRAGDRLDRHISDIGQLARAKFRNLNPEPVPAQDLVNDAMSQLEQRIEETTATLTVEGDLPLVRVDRMWGTQALYNLLLNALKFTVPGRSPEIAVTAYRDGGQAGIRVMDRGPGVRPDQADRVFGLFQRDVGREVEGTGAGLAIVRQVARRHRGDAWVEERSGGGAAFTLTFGPEAR